MLPARYDDDDDDNNLLTELFKLSNYYNEFQLYLSVTMG